MKAAVLFGKQDLRICDFPEVPMTENSVKIRVRYCGICGTDMHKFDGLPGSRPVVYPVPLGHEISGEVAEIGAKVKDFKPGDRVTVDPNWHCGCCENCKNGLFHLCTASKGVVKGMAEYICPPQENVYRLPDSLDLKTASLTEPLSCCLHGLDQLNVISGQRVALIGMGAIGTIMLQLLVRTCGARVTVLEAREDKRESALAMGAEKFICTMTENADDFLREPPQRVLECVGLPVTCELAMHIAGRGATVVLFGVPGVSATASMPLYELFSKELTIKTSYINPATTNRAIALLASGVLDTESIICAEIGLDEFPEELKTRKLCRNGKVVVRID